MFNRMNRKTSSAAQHRVDTTNPEYRKFFGFTPKDFAAHHQSLLTQGKLSDFLLYIEPQTAHFLLKYKDQLGETDCEDVYNRCLDKFCQEVLPVKDFTEKDANPMAYLSTMLNNAMLQSIEKKKVKNIVSLDESTTMMTATVTESYDADLESALNDLEAALLVMCKSCNELVDAHYWKGLKPSKIAESISEGILSWLCFGFPICGIRQNARTNENQTKNVSPNDVSQRLVRIRKDIFNFMQSK
jgi:DNA-directed RNA polymerase specialized sigma24 family protein